MSERYAAILRGNQLEWTGPAPVPSTRDAATPVTVIVRKTTESSGRKMAAALEQIAQQDPPDVLGDPAQWERELRTDRPLPGRR
jgi:hypothetical protein